jgi:hypothetical protein
MFFSLTCAQMSPTTAIPAETQQKYLQPALIAPSNLQVFETIIHTPRRTFNRPSSARGRIERVRSSSQASAGSQASDLITPVAAPPREYIQTDISELISAISKKRFSFHASKLRVHVEYSAYLVSNGHSLRYDPGKYKSLYTDLEQLVAAELKAFNVQVVSNKISFIGFSGPRPGSFEICLVWDDADSNCTSRFCKIFSKLETRR